MAKPVQAAGDWQSAGKLGWGDVALALLARRAGGPGFGTSLAYQALNRDKQQQQGSYENPYANYDRIRALLAQRDQQKQRGGGLLTNIALNLLFPGAGAVAGGSAAAGPPAATGLVLPPLAF